MKTSYYYFSYLLKFFIIIFCLGCVYSKNIAQNKIKSILKVRNPYAEKVFVLEDTIYHLKEYNRNNLLSKENIYILHANPIRVDTSIKIYEYNSQGQLSKEELYYKYETVEGDKMILNNDISFKSYKYDGDKLVMIKDSSKGIGSMSKFYFYNSKGIKIKEAVITSSSGDSIIGLFDEQGYETRNFIKSSGANFSDEAIRHIASIYNYYNSKGQLSEQKFYDQLEKKFSHYTKYLYGKKNKLLKSIKIAYPGNKLRTSDMLFSADSITNLYDNQERIIKNASYNNRSNGVNFEKGTEYSYNKLGQVTEIKAYFIDKEGYIPFIKKIFSYDESGILIKEEWIIGDSENLVYSYKYEYW